MSSFQTLFRTVVMLATLGILAKAWYLYGPTVGELQAIGMRVSELAEHAWVDYWRRPGNSSSLADDPRLPSAGGAPAPFVPSGDPMQPIPVAPSPTTNSSTVGPVQFAGGVPAEIVPVTPSSTPSSSTPWPTNAAPQLALVPGGIPTQDDRLPEMLERLTQLGVHDQELAPWGNRGDFVRFSCSVPWSNSPAYSRHFEAVAATPAAAVEQVAAEIDAWRNRQQQ